MTAVSLRPAVPFAGRSVVGASARPSASRAVRMPGRTTRGNRSIVLASAAGGGNRKQGNAIPVIVNGAAGRMGQVAVAAITKARGLELVGAIDVRRQGEDSGEVAGIEANEIPIFDDLLTVLASVAQGDRKGVLVDFSEPDACHEATRQALAFGIRTVIGTTNLSPKTVDGLEEFCDKGSIGAVLAPTFCIGQALMEKAAADAAFHYANCEVVESQPGYPEGAPSPASVQIAEGVSGLGRLYNMPGAGGAGPADGPAAGVEVGGDGVRVHSLYNPSTLSTREVAFTGTGERYSIRHEVTDPRAYAPGILLAIRRIVNVKTFVYGLEKLLM